MATKAVVAAEINVNASQGESAVGSFKKQLREANAELVMMSEKFGTASAEAQAAARKVASLKDAIGDAKGLADTFNPDKKFVALGGALQGATAGFSALQGAMGLFGSESEDLNKTLAKVQSAMALQQGISGIFGAIDSFKLLGQQVMQFGVIQKIVTAGQWLWNAAMAANPIGAIVAVVAALVAGIVALTSWLIKSSDAAKENAKQIKESGKALEEQKKAADKSADALKRNADYTLEMMKASGKSAEEIRKAEKALAAKAVVEARASYEVALHTRELERQRLAQMKANGATEENIKAQQENLNKYTENLNEQAKRFRDAKQAEIDLTSKHNIAIRQEQTDANKKAQEQRQADIDNAKKKAEEKVKANEEADKQILNAQQQNTLAMIADQNERAKIAADYALENRIAEIEALKIDQDKKKELIRLAEQENALVIKGINDKVAEDKKAKDKKDLEDTISKENERAKIVEQIRLDSITNEFIKKQMILAGQEQQELDALTEAFNNKLITEEEYKLGKENLTKIYDAKEIELANAKKDEENKIEEEKLAKKREVEKLKAQAVGNALGTISELIGQDTAAGKALGIAQALINTYIGASEAIREKSLLPQPYSTIQKIASVAAILATGFKTVKSIAGVKTPKGGGGGGASVPSTSSIVSPMISPQAQVTRLDQAQVNQIGNAASRAYVVESDVSGGQERINRLNRAARIN